MPMVIDIVRDRMATAKARSVSVLGEVLTEWLLAHKAEAEQVVEGKTLSGAFEAIKGEARKQGGNCGVLDDREALRIALIYFGITCVDASAEPVKAPKPAADALDLDSLLGG